MERGEKSGEEPIRERERKGVKSRWVVKTMKWCDIAVFSGCEMNTNISNNFCLL